MSVRPYDDERQKPLVLQTTKNNLVVNIWPSGDQRITFEVPHLKNLVPVMTKKRKEGGTTETPKTRTGMPANAHLNHALNYGLKDDLDLGPNDEPQCAQG